MSRIRTNFITNRMANGAPTVSNGLVISGVTTCNATANQPLVLNNTNTNGQSSISFQSAGTTIYNVGSNKDGDGNICLLYTSPSPRDATLSRMPSSA